MYGRVQRGKVRVRLSVDQTSAQRDERGVFSFVLLLIFSALTAFALLPVASLVR
jgi:hypothetical protein